MENQQIMTMEQIQQVIGSGIQLSNNAIQIANSNAQNIEVMMAKINQQGSLIGGLAKQLSGLDGTVSSISGRLDNLELNEEITDEQRQQLNQACKNRVSHILDYDEESVNKYFRVYILDLYKFLKNGYGMGAKISTTRKRNYDVAMKGIDSWYPNHEKLRKRADLKHNN